MSKVQLFYNQLVLLQFDVYVLELVQFLYDVLDAQMAVPFVIEAEGLSSLFSNFTCKS